MQVVAVPKTCRAPALRPQDHRPCDHDGFIIESPVGNAHIRRDRQARPMSQVFRDCAVERSPVCRADSIRARAKHQRGPFVGFGKSEPIGNRTYVVVQRVVLETSSQVREKPVRESRAQSRAIDVDVGNPSESKSPSIFISLFRSPTDCAAFAWSHRTGRNGGRAPLFFGGLRDRRFVSLDERFERNDGCWGLASNRPEGRE